jgi:hypothetical protein
MRKRAWKGLESLSYRSHRARPHVKKRQEGTREAEWKDIHFDDLRLDLPCSLEGHRLCWRAQGGPCASPASRNPVTSWQGWLVSVGWLAIVISAFPVDLAFLTPLKL